jgi:hypothetical protein
MRVLRGRYLDPAVPPERHRSHTSPNGQERNHTSREQRQSCQTRR